MKKVFKYGCGGLLALFIGIVAIATCGGSKNSDNSSSSENTGSNAPVTYTDVTAVKMVKDLKENAARARDSYEDKHLCIKGEISNFDSDGAYISLSGGEFEFQNVHIYLNDELKEKVKQYNKGDKVTVWGKCDDVGEVMGYSIRATKIE